MRGFRQGKRLSSADIARRVEAYNKKLKEYGDKTLDELKELEPTLRGSYKYACQSVMINKMSLEQANKEDNPKVENTIENSKVQDSTSGYTEEEIIENDLINSKKDEIK